MGCRPIGGRHRPAACLARRLSAAEQRDPRRHREVTPALRRLARLTAGRAPSGPSGLPARPVTGCTRGLPPPPQVLQGRQASWQRGRSLGRGRILAHAKPAGMLPPPCHWRWRLHSGWEWPAQDAPSSTPSCAGATALPALSRVTSWTISHSAPVQAPHVESLSLPLPFGICTVSWVSNSPPEHHGPLAFSPLMLRNVGAT